MGSFSLLNPVIYLDGVDMTGYMRKITLHPTCAELDVTTFATGGKGRLGGLRSVEWLGEGFMDNAAGLLGPDAELWGDLGNKDNPASASAQGSETNVSWMWLSGLTDFVPQEGAVGDPAGFTFNGKNTNSNGLVRGWLGAKSRVQAATGQLGSVITGTAIAANQFLYAIIHAHAVGTTVTIQVQSAPTFGFAAPTTRATFPAITAIGGYWLARVGGAVTDTFWRFNISAITGSFTLSGSIGIGS